MVVDTTELKGMAERLRRSARQKEVLDLCDAVLGWSPAGAVAEIKVPGPIVKLGVCPVCEARRQAKRLAMRKWRKGV